MKRDNPVTAYLNDAEKQQLTEWADECDKPQSQLVREAIIEYMDNDRTQRIEDKVDRCLSLLENGTHTHTGNNPKGSVPEKTRAIAQAIYANHTVPMKEKDIEIAIENNAGVGDHRTVAKYKKQLKKRQLLFCHPMQPVWTDDKEQWVGWVENATVGKDVKDQIDMHGMEMDEYDEIAMEVSK